MTNQEITQQAKTALLCMSLSLFLGTFIPMILAVATYFLFTTITFRECLLNVPFFLFSTIGTIIAAIYINQPKD